MFNGLASVEKKWGKREQGPAGTAARAGIKLGCSPTLQVVNYQGSCPAPRGVPAHALPWPLAAVGARRVVQSSCIPGVPDRFWLTVQEFHRGARTPSVKGGVRLDGCHLLPHAGHTVDRELHVGRHMCLSCSLMYGQHRGVRAGARNRCSTNVC